MKKMEYNGLCRFDVVEIIGEIDGKGKLKASEVNIIKNARECGLFTVQRFFIVDSQSVDTTIEAVKASKPDMIEIMPGVVFKVIGDLKKHLDVPIIAGGLIKTKQEADEAVNYGASAVSTGTENLWNKEKTV